MRFDDQDFKDKLELDLTPGEARTLAAQLLAMADMLDMLDMPDYSRRLKR